MTRLWRPVTILAVATSPMAAQTVHFEGSVVGATGRYIFTERTTAAVWSSGFSVSAGRFLLRATVPVIGQNTLLITASGAGPIPSGGGGERSRAVRDSGEARRRRGSGGRPTGSVASLAGFRSSAADPAVPVDITREFRTAVGDPVASASVRVVEGRRASLTLGASVKLPLADTAHFGSGEWDVGSYASLSLRSGDRVVVGLDASYWHLGDLATLEFSDPVAGSVSISRLFGTNWGASISGAAASSALPGFKGPASAGIAITRFVGGSAWGLNVSLGLSETSPDVVGGLTWRIKL